MRGCVILAFALALSTPALAAPPKVIAVDVDGIIHPVTAEIVASAIALAKQENAALLIVHLNTPGGLMEAMRQTIEEMIASPVPIATYVAPGGVRAASAGFFILQAGDIAAMAPGTSTGAAHPVIMGGDIDAVMKEKIENDAAAYLRSICAKRGRNSELAETAVRQSKSFTETEALNQRLIDLIAPDDRALLDALDGRTVARLDGRTQVLRTRGAEIQTYRPTLRQKIVASIADPNIALILMVIGALAIYIEFTSPGLIAPGVIGAILLLLGLSALSVLPINWLGAALLLLAFALFALEAKFTSHGVLTAGGAISLVLGAVMLIDSPLPEMRIHWITAVALAIPFSAITALLLTLALRARRSKVQTGAEAMIGEIGAAVTELAPEGKVFVHGEYWDATSLRPAPQGARVQVTAVDKLRLTVEPVPERTGG